MKAAKQIEQAKQALANLKDAIAVLIKDGASQKDIEPYKINQAEQENILRKLTGEIDHGS